MVDVGSTQESHESSAGESSALLEGPAVPWGRGSGESLAAVVAARAVEYGDQLYTEVDWRGVETSVPIASL